MLVRLVCVKSPRERTVRSLARARTHTPLTGFQVALFTALVHPSKRLTGYHSFNILETSAWSSKQAEVEYQASKVETEGIELNRDSPKVRGDQQHRRGEDEDDRGTSTGQKRRKLDSPRPNGAASQASRKLGTQTSDSTQPPARPQVKEASACGCERNSVDARIARRQSGQRARRQTDRLAGWQANRLSDC